MSRSGENRMQERLCVIKCVLKKLWSMILSFFVLNQIICIRNWISFILSFFRRISNFLISYHIISYHIISYHIISYHIISYRIISYQNISYSYSCTVLYCTVLYCTVLYCTALHWARLYFTVPAHSVFNLKSPSATHSCTLFNQTRFKIYNVKSVTSFN